MSAARRGAAAFLAIAMMAGCGTSPASLPAPNARAWMATDAKAHDLLYVVNGTTVDVFSYPQGVLEGQLAGFSSPYADCSDRNGNIYIGDDEYGALVEYAHGGTEPLREIWPPVPGAFLSNCAVDPKTGNLAVTSYGSDSGFNAYLAVYSKATGPPKTYTNSAFANYAYCTYDGRGNLFVVGKYAKDYGNNAILAELPRGGTSLILMSLNYLTGWLAGVQWDGKYLAVGQSVDPRIARYRISGTSGYFVGLTKLTSAYAIAQFIIAGKQAVVTNLYYYDRYIAKWDALVFDYPAGGNQTAEILNSGSPISSVALSKKRGTHEGGAL